MQEMTSDVLTVPPSGNSDDAVYAGMIERIQQRFEAAEGPLFTTDVADLWNEYLTSFSETNRQFHNCRTCQRFIETYGGLVTINNIGRLTPVFWDSADADADHYAAISVISRLVRRAKVTGVFLSSESVWGQSITGIWSHLAVRVPEARHYKPTTLTAWQAMAEKRADYQQVQRALVEFPPHIVSQALTILKADALFRSEKVLGQAQWLHDLHESIASGNRANLVWKAVGSAPAGFCHPRTSMIGTLTKRKDATSTRFPKRRRADRRIAPTTASQTRTCGPRSSARQSRAWSPAPSGHDPRPREREAVKLYADRKPWELEPHYSRHVSAMTTEALHAKYAIAAELAFRDAEIERLKTENARLHAWATAAEGLLKKSRNA